MGRDLNETVNNLPCLLTAPKQHRQTLESLKMGSYLNQTKNNRSCLLVAVTHRDQTLESFEMGCALKETENNWPAMCANSMYTTRIKFRKLGKWAVI